jgi:hypothetical protein
MGTTGWAEHGRSVITARFHSVVGKGGAADSRTVLRAVLFGTMLLAQLHAHGGVVQQVEARFSPSAGTEVVDSDEIIGTTSTDINQDVLAQIGSPGRYNVRAAAGRFGQVGLQVGNLNAGAGSTLVAAESEQADPRI